MFSGNPSSRKAFTLVELLVVIAIIGVLVALLLPAVQAARAAARRTQCQNNLKQVGLALLNYHSQQGEFPPSSEWPENSSGEPSIGVGNAQANWVIRCLPFMEQQTIYDAFDLTVPIPDDRNILPRGTSIAGLLCPEDGFNQEPFNGTSRSSTRDFGDNWARGNYAANAALGAMRTGATDFHAAGEQSAGWQDDALRGVMGANSSVSIARITDGTSNTILAGEIRAGIVELDVRGSWALGGGPSALWRHGYEGDAAGPNSSGREADDTVGCSNFMFAVGGPNELARQKMGCINRTQNSQQTARSLHPGGVFTTFADGSVHWIGDDIEIRVDGFRETPPYASVWDRLNLSADGLVLNNDSF